MPREKSAGAVIFRREQDRVLYLLLHYPSSVKGGKSYWDLPKGHIEGQETEEETAIREVKEETGLREFHIIKGFREVITYYFRAKGKTVFKTVVFFLAQTRQWEVTISSEHTGCIWLPYRESMSYLGFQNAKHVLQKSHAFLHPKGIRGSKTYQERPNAHVQGGGANHRPPQGFPSGRQRP